MRAAEKVFLNLNAEQIEFVLEQSKSRGLSSPSAFIRLLIEDEMQRIGFMQ